MAALEMAAIERRRDYAKPIRNSTRASYSNLLYFAVRTALNNMSALALAHHSFNLPLHHRC